MGSATVPPTDGGVICAICSVGFRRLHNHVRAHGLSWDEYLGRYGPTETVNDDVRVIMRDQWEDRHGRVHWTRERVIAALQREAARRGRPPTMKEWRRRNGRPLRLGQTWTAGHRPTAQTVVRVFGSWMAGLEAAGLTPKPRERKPARCHDGHLFTPENTYVNSRGERQCRQCVARRAREYRERLKLAAASA